jgi:hypothetical protein
MANHAGHGRIAQRPTSADTRGLRGGHRDIGGKSSRSSRAKLLDC